MGAGGDLPTFLPTLDPGAAHRPRDQIPTGTARAAARRPGADAHAASAGRAAPARGLVQT